MSQQTVKVSGSSDSVQQVISEAIGLGCSVEGVETSDSDSTDSEQHAVTSAPADVAEEIDVQFSNEEKQDKLTFRHSDFKTRVKPIEALRKARAKMEAEQYDSENPNYGTKLVRITGHKYGSWYGEGIVEAADMSGLLDDE